MRLEFLNTVEEYKGKLEPYMDQLEKQGLWEKVGLRNFNYLLNRYSYF